MMLHGTVNGGRRKGRQNKRWEDNITERICLKFRDTLPKVENWEGWRKVVAWPSLVDQRLSRLRNKLSEVKYMPH